MEPINAQTPGVRFYQDTQPLKNLRGEEGLRAAAEQFEAMYLQMMVKSMRSANNAIAGENGMFNSQQSQFYQEMADSQMAMEMAGKSNLGIADAMVRQMSTKLNNQVKSDAISNNMVGTSNQQPIIRMNKPPER